MPHIQIEYGDMASNEDQGGGYDPVFEFWTLLICVVGDPGDDPGAFPV